MTNKNYENRGDLIYETSTYVTPGSHNLQIPNRSEFHKYLIDNITVGDFSTGGCADGGTKIKKIAHAINWSKAMHNKYYIKKFSEENRE